MKPHVQPTIWEQSALHLGCAFRHLWRALVAISTLPILTGIITSAILLAFVISLTGCRTNAGRILLKGGGLEGPQLEEVRGVKDAGTPATASTETQNASIKLPAGSVITEIATEAQPATESAPSRPAYTVREIKLTADTAWIERAQKISANTGTVDTTVAKHSIEAAERRPLLFVAIAALVSAIALKAFIPAWPILSNGAAAVAVLSFAAWKVSEVPTWLIGGVIVGVFLIVAAYKRAEWDSNRNFVPDAFEKK